jgi:hypothetical protein
MRMTRNTKILLIIFMPIAVIFGMWFGRAYPLLGLLFFIGLIAYLAWLLMSNKQGARTEGAELADAMAAVPAPGKGRIYVLRSGFYGRAQGMNIGVSSGHEGQIRGNFFMMAQLDPGTYTVTGRMARGSEKTRRNLDIQLEAGQSVLIDISLEMTMTRVNLIFTEQAEPAAIMAKLRSAKMVDWLVKP